MDWCWIYANCNPGGVLNGAVDVVDDFLDDGVIVQTKGRGNGSDQS